MGSSATPVLLLEHVDSLPWWRVSGYRQFIPQEQSMKYIFLFSHESMNYGWSGSSVLVATTDRPKECRTALQGTGDYET